MGEPAAKPWWRDVRGAPPEPRWRREWREKNLVGPGEFPSPDWVNIVIMTLAAGYVGVNIWARGVSSGLLVGLVAWIPIVLASPAERAWKRNHPGVRRRTTGLHLAVVGTYAVLVAVGVTLALVTRPHPPEGIGQAVPALPVFVYVAWRMRTDAARRKRSEVTSRST